MKTLPHPTKEILERIKGKSAYFILDSERDENGEYIALIAKENESGYYRTDWKWGTDKFVAQQCADSKNDALELGRLEVFYIILHTMRKQKG